MRMMPTHLTIAACLALDAWIVASYAAAAPLVAGACGGIYDLRCEYQAEPLGVVNPRFFWKYAGKRPEKFTLTVYDGSGVVATQETEAHLYVAPSMALAPFHRYWWRVEGAGDSATGTFVTGLREWRMPFFKPGWKRDPLEYWVARKGVELRGAKSVVVALASLGTHRLYVNGKPASDGSGPNRSHVEDGFLLAETYDVTHLVKDGMNEFAVYMDDGWARLGQTREKESCLSVDGRAETADGVVAIDSSSPWRVAKSADRAYGPVAVNAWSHGKVRRGIERLHDVETLTDESDGVLRTGRPFSVASDSSPRNRVVRRIRPVSVEPHGEGWKIDMGEAFTGFVRLRLKGERGRSARMTVSDNFVDECNFGQAYELAFCGGDGVFENRLDTQSGRFLYLTGCERPSPGDVEGLVVSCAGLRTGGFSGDKDLERILSLDANTFAATTFGGVTVDCPHRERLGYGEAALSTMWGAGLPLFDTAAFYGAYLLKWASSQRPDGSLPHVSPNGYGWGGTFWSCFPVYGLAEYCRYYPDARLVESMRPVVDRWLDYLDSHVKGGLLEQYEPKKGDCLGDWAYPEVWEKKKTWGDWGHTPEGKFFNNCSYAWAIRLALETEGLVADPSRRDELKRRHAALVAAIDREWYRDGIYVSPDARYQAIAIVCGAAEAGGHAAETERATLDIVERKGYVDGGSPSYTVILRVLCRSDRGRELALRTFRRREAPSFLFFADEGYNTIPESWHYGRDSHGSMMHTCYTGPAGMLMRGFAGIDVNGSEIVVSPFLSDSLPVFSAHTETLYGTLSVKVGTKDGGRIVEVDFPAGCKGCFIAQGESRPLSPGLNRFEIPKTCSTH